MSFEAVTGHNLPATKLPFSAAVRVGNLVFISGQASVDDQGNIVSDTFENEFRRTFANLQRILDAAGVTLADLVQVRSYVKNSSDLPEYNRLYREYFREPYPARTTLTGCLGKILFEIDAIAAKST